MSVTSARLPNMMNDHLEASLIHLRVPPAGHTLVQAWCAARRTARSANYTSYSIVKELEGLLHVLCAHAVQDLTWQIASQFALRSLMRRH